MNRMKTVILLATMTALFMWIGQALGGRQGAVFALIVAGVMNFISFWFSDKIVLRMQGAKEIDETMAPDLFAMVRELATTAQLPMPRVYVMATDTPNAFATGRNPEHAAVAVTEGILKLLSKEELKGVIGHELGHVINRDTLIMTITATLSGALSHLAQMAMWRSMLGGRRSDEEGNGNGAAGLIGVILAPIIATLIQMAISRTREFTADETGARLSGSPHALASALQKIEQWSKRIPLETASPSTAHMFIINPLTGSSMLKLFSTHPPTEERVARLEKLANEIMYR